MRGLTRGRGGWRRCTSSAPGSEGRGLGGGGGAWVERGRALVPEAVVHLQRAAGGARGVGGARRRRWLRRRDGPRLGPGDRPARRGVAVRVGRRGGPAGDARDAGLGGTALLLPGERRATGGGGQVRGRAPARPGLPDPTRPPLLPGWPRCVRLPGFAAGLRGALLPPPGRVCVQASVCRLFCCFLRSAMELGLPERSLQRNQPSPNGFGFLGSVLELGPGLPNMLL